jgi:hypothetical protein
MKKHFLVLIMIFSFGMGYASPPTTIANLNSKVILQNTTGYFVLSDHSCWKVMGFAKRMRSFNEWWNDVQLVPKNYECVPNDWYLGTQIEVYSKYDNLEVNEADASNQEALKQTTHLLVNTRTGQVLFAIAMEPAECLAQLYADSYNEGYDKGYYQGYTKSSESANASYEYGYSNGYRSGYAEGYQAGLQEGRPGTNPQ